jgi:hypothetical protein
VCYEDGYLNGMGVKPKEIPEDNGTPVEIPDFSTGLLPNLS